MSLNRALKGQIGNAHVKEYSFNRRLGRRIEGSVVAKFDKGLVLNQKENSSTNPVNRGFIVGGDGYSKVANLYTDLDDDYYGNVKVVITTGFEEEHRNMLIGKGIIPMVFSNKDDVNLLGTEDQLLIDDLELNGENYIYISNKNISVKVDLIASQEEKEVLKGYV